MILREVNSELFVEEGGISISRFKPKALGFKPPILFLLSERETNRLVGKLATFEFMNG